MNRSGSSLWVPPVLCLCLAASAVANVKGGSLEGISPYGSWEKVDASRVKEQQRESNRLKEARCDSVPKLRYVTGFAQIGADGTRGPLSPFLIAWTGTRRLKIPLSQIESLVVKAVDRAKGQVLCRLTVFPDVSPEDLAKTKPDYASLSTRHRATCDASIQAGTVVVGRSLPGEANPQFSIAFADIPIGAGIRFYGRDIHYANNYWWAIPSVWQDPKYPYRWEPSRK